MGVRLRGCWAGLSARSFSEPSILAMCPQAGRRKEPPVAARPGQERRARSKRPPLEAGKIRHSQTPLELFGIIHDRDCSSDCRLAGPCRNRLLSRSVSPRSRPRRTYACRLRYRLNPDRPWRIDRGAMPAVVPCGNGTASRSRCRAGRIAGAATIGEVKAILGNYQVYVPRGTM
jgi:hypothetical protein